MNYSIKYKIALVVLKYKLSRSTITTAKTIFLLKISKTLNTLQMYQTKQRSSLHLKSINEKPNWSKRKR